MSTAKNIPENIPAIGSVSHNASSTFCSARCGRGCTRAEYDQANADGKALAQALGARWVYETWENLGWHYRAFIPNTPFEITPVKTASNDTWYRAWIQTTPQFISDEHGDPREAMREAISKMQAIFDEVSGVVSMLQLLDDGTRTSSDSTAKAGD